MHYFDSREMALGVDHVMASGALPPWFPAIRVGGEAYWDGGVYSNTPVEVVFDDNPRRDALVFAVNVWQPTGPEPQSILQVMGREKDIQYASRADSQIERQRQIHHLRRVINELVKYVPEGKKHETADHASWGCHTRMHVMRLLAPALAGEDYWKDIDFSSAGIGARWRAGLEDTRRMIAEAPWKAPVDPMEGVVMHDPMAMPGHELAVGSGRLRREDQAGGSCAGNVTLRLRCWSRGAGRRAARRRPSRRRRSRRLLLVHRGGVREGAGRDLGGLGLHRRHDARTRPTSRSRPAAPATPRRSR